MFETFKDYFYKDELGQWQGKAAHIQLNEYLQEHSELKVKTWQCNYLTQSPPWCGGDIVVTYLCVEFEVKPND